MQVPVTGTFSGVAEIELPEPPPGPGGPVGPFKYFRATSPVQVVTLDGLDGEADGAYRLIYRIKNDSHPSPGNVTVYDLRPNDLTPSGMHTLRWSIWDRPQDGYQIQRDVFAFWLMGGADFDMTLCGEMMIHAAAVVEGANLERHFTGQFSTFGSGVHISSQTGGRWVDSSTPIVKFAVHSDIPDGIGKGSEFALYKIGR